MKGCNHAWEKQPDGTYYCVICTGVSKTVPKELLKQTTLSSPKDEYGGGGCM